MIRNYLHSDTEALLAIWLHASLKAHNFIEEGYWKSQLDNMKNIYLPSAETHMFEQSNQVLGFYSLHQDNLAALFVAPAHQGQGIGRQLLAHAISQRETLSLTVYKENQRSVAFYLANGFTIVNEQADPHTGHPEYSMTLASDR